MNVSIKLTETVKLCFCYEMSLLHNFQSYIECVKAARNTGQLFYFIILQKNTYCPFSKQHNITPHKKGFCKSYRKDIYLKTGNY